MISLLLSLPDGMNPVAGISEKIPFGRQTPSLQTYELVRFPVETIRGIIVWLPQAYNNEEQKERTLFKIA
jgi:hypothetical protein